MKLSIIIILAACLQVSAKGYSNTVTLNLKNESLEKVFHEIRKQTGYDFVFDDNVKAKDFRINVSVVNGDLRTLLRKIFERLPLDYKFEGNTVYVSLGLSANFGNSQFYVIITLIVGFLVLGMIFIVIKSSGIFGKKALVEVNKETNHHSNSISNVTNITNITMVNPTFNYDKGLNQVSKEEDRNE